MDRRLVSSSSVRSVGYDSDRQVLEVEFKPGSIYQYDGVPELLFTGLVNASSVGKYLNQNIKDRYSCRRVR